jgi:hypothetical protein
VLCAAVPEKRVHLIGKYLTGSGWIAEGAPALLKGGTPGLLQGMSLSLQVPPWSGVRRSY